MVSIQTAPKMIKIIPEIRLTQNNLASVILDLKRLLMPLKRNHQNNDPKKTPAVINKATPIPLCFDPKPSAAKIAMKPKMVAGLLIAIA